MGVHDRLSGRVPTPRPGRRWALGQVDVMRSGEPQAQSKRITGRGRQLVSLDKMPSVGPILNTPIEMIPDDQIGHKSSTVPFAFVAEEELSPAATTSSRDMTGRAWLQDPSPGLRFLPHRQHSGQQLPCVRADAARQGGLPYRNGGRKLASAPASLILPFLLRFPFLSAHGNARPSPTWMRGVFEESSRTGTS
ncbi:hypothetical protein B0T16DRAFT_43877 [Cercophora newfieldiana]|uniref:Uncharacterized protein n=1 Tax=Cercophora newfieldiana TaxID=92897 RepID=A0AA39YRE9_9PEZI|nr:hypothetical protein B0T16DRAFT_43877 [Cercophora newfieldiana]